MKVGVTLKMARTTIDETSLGFSHTGGQRINYAFNLGLRQEKSGKKKGVTFEHKGIREDEGRG
jgi:hypothetical protein